MVLQGLLRAARDIGCKELAELSQTNGDLSSHQPYPNDVCFGGAGFPVQVSRCRKTASFFILRLQMGHATSPSSGIY